MKSDLGKVGVLIIEDDSAMREVLSFLLSDQHVSITTAGDGKTGLSLFDPARHQIVFTDLRMPGVDGMAVLREIKDRSDTTIVIVITAYGDIPVAVQAIKLGAYDFIQKPFEREYLVSVFRKALEVVRLKHRINQLEEQLGHGQKQLIYASPAMEAVVSYANEIAKTDAPVLLTGESGTGKEVLAKWIHWRGHRRHSPFVAINCSALPRDLLESELFGHVKGAFTGALKDYKGRFEQANGGTLFLDEIADMSLDLQPKLLRVLEEGRVPVIGLEKEREIDVRIITATNANISEAISQGKFRHDLYFRLSVMKIHIPPLRERIEDIPVLADHFVKKWGNRDFYFEDSAYEILKGWDWPGNVRELESLCRRIVLFARDERITADLVMKTMDFGVSRVEPKTLWDVERYAIEQALKNNNYNQTKAAKALGIPRYILLYRMKKFGIKIPEGYK